MSRVHNPPHSKTLIVEGWRFLPHSYAVVNQWQLLSLLRYPELSIKVIDAPLYHPDWKNEDGLFEPKQEQDLRAIASAQFDEAADVTFRIFARFDFSPSRSRRTAVFATAERQCVEKSHLRDPLMYEKFKRDGGLEEVEIVTPSRWSAEAFYNEGFSRERVHIIPHGVDLETFYPMPDLRNDIRSDMGIHANDFVFLNVGAITSNKGVDLVLRAFAEIHRKFPHTRLILKGMDPLYRSDKLLDGTMSQVPLADQERIAPRISYFGQSFSFREMAMLYQAADAYVSPYRAEGFNIPVLEAAACGVPVICTQGGATDDFVTGDFARKIASTKTAMKKGDQDLWHLNPDLEHLIELMTAAVDDGRWRDRAARAGPAHIRAHYTWDRVTSVLVSALFG